MRILVLYATRRNSTAEVARYISHILQEQQLEVTTANVDTFDGDIGEFDAYVFGSSIYSGMWLHPLIEKIRQSQTQIGQKPVWCWAMCIRVLEEGGLAYVRSNYVPEHVLDTLNLQDFRFFAGKLFMDEIDMEERWTLAVRYDGTQPPTDFNDDYRDWSVIGLWARTIAAALKQRITAGE